MPENYQPIGVFDSGYGGLTVFRELLKVLPEYDYIYLGDNARNPYGTRSFDVVYEYTWQSVRYLFDQGCQLVILACNTASAKALRNIQQKELPVYYPERRVLGVIRPSVEMIPQLTKNMHVGVLGTTGPFFRTPIRWRLPKYPLTARFQSFRRLVRCGCPLWRIIW